MSLEWNTNTNKATLSADLAVSGNLTVTGILTAPVSAAMQTALNLKANLASPTFTGTVGGLTKAMVNLSNFDNTSDLAKVVSTTPLAALTLKADKTELAAKANSVDVFLKADTYSRTKADSLFNSEIDTYTAPLRLALNPVTLKTDLSIDPTNDLSIANVTASGGLTVAQASTFQANTNH